MTFSISITNAAGETLLHKRAENEITAVYDGEYREGDCIHVTCSEPEAFALVQLDDTMPAALLFLKGSCSLTVPFNEKKASYSPKSFSGTRHYLHVRSAYPHEIMQRRNLACNPYDSHGNTTLFPRTEANIETRGESVFASRNAIDGLLANTFHGEWPYTSWGINRDPAAEFTLFFGRTVRVEEIVLYLRADFPHDAWWTQADVTFSDGQTMPVHFQKSGAAQHFAAGGKETDFIRLSRLIKADDPSPFPALTQIEVYGTEAGSARP